MNRKRQRLFRFAVDTFVSCLEQITKKKHPIKCNDTDVKSFDSFVDKFSESIGEEFISKFVLYGLQSWFNDGSSKDYSRNIRLSWIFGSAAIKRWEACSIETNVFITRSGLKTRHKINITKRTSSMKEFANSLIEREEINKKEFLNTSRGFLWCIANTTLYFHKSLSCVVCSSKNECKSLLKRDYPKIYEIRGYGK